MADLGLKTFNKLYPMMIRKYQDLIVDQNATEKDKINQIIQKLNALGKLSNDVVRDWNTVYQWVMNDGLATDVNNKIEAMNANGELNTLLHNIFVSLTGDMATLHTNAKDTTVNAINEVDDLSKQLQTNQGDLTTLQTTDKDSLVHAINDNVAQLAQNTQQLTDIVVTARSIGLVAGDATKATQNATTLNQYLATAQNTEITFLGKEYFFDDTVIATATNKLIGKKGTKFSLTVTNKDCILLNPFGAIENILINLPLNHTKSGLLLNNADYTQWFTNHLHYAKNIFIYGNPTSLSSLGISLNADNGYNVSNFSCNNVTVLNCQKGVSLTQSGNGWVNGNFFDNIYLQNCITGIYAPAGSGNRFLFQYQFGSSGQKAIYCNGGENTFIGKIWDAIAGQIEVHFDSNSKNNIVIGTGLTPNIVNSYVIDYGQNNQFPGFSPNVPQVLGAYKYDANNNYILGDWQKFFGSYSDILFYADKKYSPTLTLGSSSIVFGSLASLFSNGGLLLANATDVSPVVIEIIFPTAITNVPEFGITFMNGCIPQSVKVEYASSSGGSYTTAINTTTNKNYRVQYALSAYGGTIGKLKFTLSNAIVNATTNPSGNIQIGNIFAFSTKQLGSYFLPAGGSNVYGDMTYNTSSVGPILKDTTNGNTYRLQMVNGVLTPQQVS